VELKAKLNTGNNRKQLNKKQKRMIDKWFNLNWTGIGSISDIDDMLIELVKKIENINDHETIVHNINRYIRDKVNERMIQSSL